MYSYNRKKHAIMLASVVTFICSLQVVRNIHMMLSARQTFIGS